MNTETQIQTQPRALTELVRPNIWKMKPYTSDRNYLAPDGIVYLDANERPDDPTTPYNRYPDSNQTLLKSKIAALQGLLPEQVFVGNGSDEIIDLIFRIFCRPGQDKAVTFTPGFSMYRVIAQLNDVALMELPLDGQFQPSSQLLLPFADDERAKLLLLCSPNNPTGNSFDDLEALIERFTGVIVVDEAYIDFSERPSFLAKLAAYPNLIVTQTLSKGSALAGARVGFAFASREIISLLNAARMPYNVSTLNQRAAIEILDSPNDHQAWKEIIWSERAKLAAALEGNPMVQTVYPSDANFLLVRTVDAALFCNELLARNIVVRNQSSALPECVRITVGAPEENERLLKALQVFSKKIEA